jgi:hypothetical protein
MDVLIGQLEKDVMAICFPEGRRAGSRGSDRAREYLLGRMHDLGLVPYGGNKDIDLPYKTSYGMTFHNLIGVLKGKNSALAPVLIGAHYDSPIDAPCADDNAAAVAITLSAAERIKTKDIERDFVIAIFDAEEAPYFSSSDMGSVRFFENSDDKRGFNAAAIMDLVGHDVPAPRGLPEEIADTIGRLLFMTGAESAPGLADIIGRTCIPEGLGVIAALNSYVGDMSDHRIFRLNRVPYLFLSCGHWPHYHMKTDTIEKLNFSKISLICKYLVGLSSELAASNVLKSGTDADTVKFEIGSVEKALGRNYEGLLNAIGIGKLKGRKDMDRFADVLKGSGI